MYNDEITQFVLNLINILVTNAYKKKLWLYAKLFFFKLSNIKNNLLI